MRVASSRLTRLALSVGTGVSAGCFLIALALDLVGRPGTSGDPSDLRALAGSLTAFEPWGWATLGTLAVIVTPAAGLVATLIEYRDVGDRRTAGLAIVVLAILAASLVAGLLRQS